MLVSRWEDPFNDEVSVHKGPTLWTPRQRVPPVNLKLIRKRQNPLLPILRHLRSTALEVLKRVEADPRLGGEMLLEKTARDLFIQVLYRAPDSPSILCIFGPIHVRDNPVILPVKQNTTSIINSLLYEQATKESVFQNNPVDVSQLGLIQHAGIQGEETGFHRIVVFPKTLRFMMHWIGNLKSPISDIKVVHADGTDIQMRPHMERRPNRRNTPKLN